jgi:hypothetical protein
VFLSVASSVETIGTAIAGCSRSGVVSVQAGRQAAVSPPNRRAALSADVETGMQISGFQATPDCRVSILACPPADPPGFILSNRCF